MKPIYEPKGRAKEYGDLALNIYTGCPHRCTYCYSPSVLRRDKEDFHGDVRPRVGIIEATRRQLANMDIRGKTIHLCFSCDPYPTGCDNDTTRSIISLIKDAGGHVQILTKGDGSRDFDLLDENDWYGISYSGYTLGTIADKRVADAEPGAIAPATRILRLCQAHQRGIKTWISFEPVLEARDVLNFLTVNPDYVDKVKIGKLNYFPSDINWAEFGRQAEAICRSNHMDYYIKEGLRAEMDAEEA